MLDFSVTFFITIINIVILFFILRAILFKPVTKFMNDRSRKIQDDIDTAEKNKREAKHLLEQYEKRLSDAELEAETIIRVAREHAEAEAGRITAGAKAEVDRMVAGARARLEAERLGAMAVFKAEAASLVVSAAGRLVKRNLTGPEQLRYAEEALKSLDEEHPNVPR
ncbi:MAG: F0F1 ATP synthase subunit B [Spirochaetaceae bacterium]|jgi:F-type H+-transporting ATPase subunit b|nr:F0F1 ATP synthase subunit B [Spirochaetaceae bacterium]